MNHPTLKEELKRIDSVVILPPQVEVVLLTLTGEDERLTETENEIREKVLSIAKQRIIENKYDLVDFDFDTAIQEDADFAYAITQIKEGFTQAKEQIKIGDSASAENNPGRTGQPGPSPGKKKSHTKSIEGPVSIGEATNIIQSVCGADAMLLITYKGFDKTGGYVARDIGTSVAVALLTMGTVVPVSQKSGAIIEIALVDGVSGEILWADQIRGTLDEGPALTAIKSMPVDVDEMGKDS